MPERQGGLEVRSGFRVGKDGERFLPGHTVGNCRLPGPSGQFQVMGEAGREMPFGERIGGPAVKQASPDRSQTLIDSLSDHLVGEAQPGPRFLQDAAPHHGLDRTGDLFLRPTGDRPK